MDNYLKEILVFVYYILIVNNQPKNELSDWLLLVLSIKKVELGIKPCCPGPKVIKLFSYSTQLSKKFVLLINLKLLTIVNSFLLNIAEHEIFSTNKYENANYCWHFHIY